MQLLLHRWRHGVEQRAGQQSPLLMALQEACVEVYLEEVVVELHSRLLLHRSGSAITCCGLGGGGGCICVGPWGDGRWGEDLQGHLALQGELLTCGIQPNNVRNALLAQCLVVPAATEMCIWLHLPFEVRGHGWLQGPQVFPGALGWLLNAPVVFPGPQVGDFQPVMAW